VTTEGLIHRATRRARKEGAAVHRAAAVGRAADGPLAAAAMFAVGMAHATPARWCSRVLHGLGVERLRLRPRRLEGYELVVNPSDGGHTCVVEEFFVPPVACDLALVEFDPAAIIDCGAHIGVFTLLARRQFSSAAITAFEPNPDNVEWLRDNLRRNGVSGVDVVPAAVSTTAGRSAFRFTSNQSESGRLVEPRATLADTGGATEEVTVIDLPAFVRRLAPASLLLKLDIEGDEERLLPALLPALPRRCAIFFETHRGAEGWDAVRGALAADAFSVRLLRQRDVFNDGFALRL
jgi:FkbM family methyltransferase